MSVAQFYEEIGKKPIRPSGSAPHSEGKIPLESDDMLIDPGLLRNNKNKKIQQPRPECRHTHKKYPAGAPECPRSAGI
jgi:hypothetical protein